MIKNKICCALIAIAAFALSAQADFYWLAVGIAATANTQVDGGLGNYLVLTNDDPSVSFAPVKLYDVRRRTAGQNGLYKSNGKNDTAPYEGCPLGGAHYDLRLPIRDAAGNEFTFVGFGATPWAGMKAAGNPIWFEAAELLGEIKAKAKKEA